MPALSTGQHKVYPYRALQRVVHARRTVPRKLNVTEFRRIHESEKHGYAGIEVFWRLGLHFGTAVDGVSGSQRHQFT